MKDSTFEKYQLVVDEWFVNGFNGTKAYQKYYPESTDETSATEFIKILRIPKVQNYAQSKREGIKKAHNITLEGQLKKLDRIRKKAEQIEKLGDAVNAIKEENKLAALYEEDNSQKKLEINIPKKIQYYNPDA